MKATTFVQCTVGLILILVLLTACDGGGFESNFTVHSDGFNFPNAEPQFFAKETFTTELPLVNHTGIRLEAVHGNIEIEGRDDINSVTVIAQKWALADSLEDAEANMNNLEILVTDQIDEVLIQTIQPENILRRRYLVDYHIILPSALETEVTLINGDISVLNVQNRLKVDSENGNVSLVNIISAGVVVSLGNGSIDSTMVLPLDGEIRMSTINGNIDLSIPTSTSAEFAASVNNGLVRIFNLEIDAVVRTNQLVTGTLGAGEGLIDLGSINGNISVKGVD